MKTASVVAMIVGCLKRNRKTFKKKKKKKAFRLSSVVSVTCFTNEVKPLSQILPLIQTLNLLQGGVSAGVGGVSAGVGGVNANEVGRESFLA